LHHRDADQATDVPFEKKYSFIHSFITGSIARSATRRYLSYPVTDFEVFRPAGATRCTDGGEIWRGEGDPSSMPNFTSNGAHTYRKKEKTDLHVHTNV